jgi:hypothetical protein
MTASRDLPPQLSDLSSKAQFLSETGAMFQVGLRSGGWFTVPKSRAMNSGGR